MEILGCQDSLALNYDSTATDAGGCDYLGCTDSLYIEFNQNATIDDGSCDILKVLVVWMRIHLIMILLLM